MSNDLARLARLVRLTLGINVGMLLVNAALFYLLVIYVVDEPATVEGVSIGAAGTEATNGDPREEMREFFKRTNSLLERTARRHGTNPMDVCPTTEEFDAAVESRTMHSPESELVLQKLREGYDYYNLTWPVAVPQR
jgi:hypothetical protein